LSPSTVATLFNRARTKGYQVVLVISGDPLGIFGEEEGGEPDSADDDG